jgi:predicted hydrocarbon binding protein
MTEARVGRLLPASLHQAISEQIPDRLEFYEEWLHSEGLRDGSIGLAPMIAVLGFLRTEGQNYPVVVSEAGRLAAGWAVASLPAWRRRLIEHLPRGLRRRAALRVASRLIREAFVPTRATVEIRRGHARVQVDGSFFCRVRDRQAEPLCGFYAALVAETLMRFGLLAETHVESCKAVGAATCAVAVDLTAS